MWSLGYVPTVYSSEWAAIREVGCNGPRVVIIGDHYPYHGRTLLQLFRRCWGNEFLAIAVTDPATADSRLDLLAMGADNFLAAPLTAESASRQLEPLLQRKPTSLATA
jgi:DNA-binding response OmpR family regulator